MCDRACASIIHGFLRPANSLDDEDITLVPSVLLLYLQMSYRTLFVSPLVARNGPTGSRANVGEGCLD